MTTSKEYSIRDLTEMLKNIPSDDIQKNVDRLKLELINESLIPDVITHELLNRTYGI